MRRVLEVEGGGFAYHRPWWSLVLPPPFYAVVVIPQPRGGPELRSHAEYTLFPWKWMADMVFASVSRPASWAMQYAVEMHVIRRKVGGGSPSIVAGE